MNILALDLGTKTGFATTDGRSGTRNFATKRTEGAGMLYLRFRKWLEDEFPQGSIDALFFEEVRRHNGVLAGHLYGGMRATVLAWCEEHRVPYQSVPVGTIKKHISGNGSASKKKVIASIVKKYGVIPDDDNHADALAILSFAEDSLRLKPKTV